MENRKSIPAVGIEVATIFVAIELSTVSWVLALQSSIEARPSRHKLHAGDFAGLVGLIDRLRGRLLGQGVGRVKVVSIHEAGRDGFWLHRRLEGEDIESHVVDPGSILVRRRARRAKSDRLDAEGLLRLLMRREAGDLGLGRMCVVPSLAEEDARRPTRERARLLGERNAHANRIRGLLALHGISSYRPLRADRHRALEALRCADGRELPCAVRAEIERELERLDLAERQIGVIEKTRLAVHKQAADRPSQIIGQLMGLKGIAIETASVLTREVFYRSFQNRRALTSFVGLAPAPFKSGTIDHQQGIAKAGNRRARSMLVELAWRWLRHQGESGLSLWFKARLKQCRTRAQKCSLVVALAGRLLVQLWRYVTTGVLPEGAALKA
jgi:transposase